MAVRRWIFDDGIETYTFDHNPTTYDPLYPDRVYTVHQSTALTGQTVLFEGRRSPVVPQVWSFSGDIFTEAQYQALGQWFFLKNRIKITNQLLQVIYFQPQNFKPSPRLAFSNGGLTVWRHTYVGTGLVTRVEEPDENPILWGALPDGT